jgi:hypothetical protein
MANHRWKEEGELNKITKLHVCTKCGIYKEWIGGDYQCWEYWWIESCPATNGGVFSSVKKTYKRPECKVPLK